MSKVYLGIIFTLLLGLGFGFWQYSSVLESLGELEQANRQLLTNVNSMEEQKQQLIKQQKQASEISSEHHEKALQIVNAEMLSKQRLLQYKIKQLKQQLSDVQFKVVSTNKDAINKEQVNEKKVNDCAESIIPEFYLKQL
jgi:vacuolar-type H+-ATPase subunit I/STV1